MTADEIEAIVEATNKPYRQLKDVALQYRVSSDLVSRLVKEAEKRSEKL